MSKISYDAKIKSRQLSEFTEKEEERMKELKGKKLPCPHARPHWSMCPHCLGINKMKVNKKEDE